MERVQVKKLDSRAVLPTRGSESAAGYDLCACLGAESVTIPPHAAAKLGTGLALALPEGTFGAVELSFGKRKAYSGTPKPGDRIAPPRKEH